MKPHHVTTVLAVGITALTFVPGAAAEPTVDARLNVTTSIPDPFNGMDLNTFLGADRFYNAGYTGNGTISAVVEGGLIWDGHETLGHVSELLHYEPLLPGDQTSDLYHRHATAVAGLLGGRATSPGPGNAYQQGIAYGTDLRSGALSLEVDNDSSAFSAGISAMELVYGQFFGTADVINSSWGFVDSTGTDTFTRLIDSLANENPHTTSIFSAGNTGSDSNTVGGPGSGYNSITVAALKDHTAYDKVADFSSRSPTDYSAGFGSPPIAGVRAAIDIAAPGTLLTVADYDGPSATSDDYIGGQGTSYAAPIVAGGVALLHSAQANDAQLSLNPHADDARVIKAVLLNAADKVSGDNDLPWDNGQVAHHNGYGGVYTTQSLDYAVGAGRMNLDRTFDQYVQAVTADVAGTEIAEVGVNVGQTGWDFAYVDETDSNLYHIDTELLAGNTFAVTLAWFRDMANLGTPEAVDAQANLDLIVHNVTTGHVIAESVSTYNVVEHLYFDLPETGFYSIEVAYLDDLFDNGGHTTQAYGLAWSVIPEPATMLTLLAMSLATTLRRPTRT